MKKIETKTFLKIATVVFVLFLLIHYWSNISGFLKTVVSATTPIIIGFVIAYVVNILMSFYERHYFPKSNKKAVKKSRRPVCLIGAVLSIMGIIVLIVALVVPQLTDCIKLLVAELPGAIEMVINKLKQSNILSEDLFNTLSEVDWKSKIGDIIKNITSGFGNVVDVAVSTFTSIFSGVSNAIIGFIFALYLLLDKNRLISQFQRVTKHYVPDRIFNKIKYVLTVTNNTFHRFIVGQCTEAVILGTLCMVGMLILRLPYAPMIGALTAFTALIPIVGAFIGAGVGVFLIFMESPVKALIFLVFIIVLQQIEGDLIYPKVVGSSIGLPGIWVLAAVTVGGGVLGIGGMMLGVPLVAVVYRLLKESLNSHNINKNMISQEVS